MQTIKTSELIGAALDWSVARCEGKRLPKYQIPGTPCAINVSPGGHDTYQPSTDWSQGGPIIEMEKISVAEVGRSADDAIAPHPECWAAHIDGAYCRYGPTPLIAAMRCYVASKLGDTVNVPEELL